MDSKIKKTISSLLLFVLAWSCFGLSFGMISHGSQVLQTVSAHTEMSLFEGGHDCCGLESSNEGAQTGLATEHHTILATLINSQMIMLIFVFTGLVFVYYLQPTQLIILHLALYVRLWREKYLYFALFFRRLFSKGILHPKTW